MAVGFASYRALLAAGYWLALACGSAAWAQQAPAAPDTPPAAVATAPVTSSGCPALPAEADPRSPQSLLLHIEPWQERCLKNAAYFRLRGQLQLRTGQALLAAQSLERALLLEPEHPGAQLDYVQALVALGDLRSAQQLLSQIMERPDLPAALRPLLQQQRAALDAAAQQPSSAALTWASPVAEVAPATSHGAQRWTITQSLVRDSNLNNAPSAQSLTLTLPQGNVTLPLEPSALPQAGGALQSELQWLALRPDGSSLWLWQADLRHRHTAARAQRYTQVEAAATWLQQPDAPQQWVARISAGQLAWAGNRAYESFKATAQRQNQTQALMPWLASHPAPGATPGQVAVTCRRSFGAEWELRRQPAAPLQNGQYSGLNLGWHCHNTVPASAGHTLHNLRWGSQLRVGQDHPQQSARPGQDQLQLEWRTEWVARWHATQLQLEYSLSGLADSSGYSPLLGNNAKRRIWRHGLQASLAIPLPLATPSAGHPVPDLVLQLEHAQQRSNLQAFASRQSAIRLGLRWVLP